MKRKIVSFIARMGYVTKGFVYFFVGLLAMQAAIGITGEAQNTTQTLQEFIYKPFGNILIIGCMIGLFAHALWKILQGISDPEERKKGSGTTLFRVVDFFTGCLYLSMSYACWQILQGLNATDGDESTEVWVGKILVLPYGQWIVFLCAFIIILTGLFQFYSSYTANFDYSFDSNDMSEKERNWLSALGRIGISSWGIVYCMVGLLFYRAAVSFEADEAGGMAEALNGLREWPYGIWVLALTALGLIIYGIYLFVLSYYHKIYGSKKMS